MPLSRHDARRDRRARRRARSSRSTRRRSRHARCRRAARRCSSASSASSGRTTPSASGIPSMRARNSWTGCCPADRRGANWRRDMTQAKAAAERRHPGRAAQPRDRGTARRAARGRRTSAADAPEAAAGEHAQYRRHHEHPGRRADRARQRRDAGFRADGAAEGLDRRAQPAHRRAGRRGGQRPQDRQGRDHRARERSVALRHPADRDHHGGKARPDDARRRPRQHQQEPRA